MSLKNWKGKLEKENITQQEDEKDRQTKYRTVKMYLVFQLTLNKHVKWGNQFWFDIANLKDLDLIIFVRWS